MHYINLIHHQFNNIKLPDSWRRATVFSYTTKTTSSFFKEASSLAWRSEKLSWRTCRCLWNSYVHLRFLREGIYFVLGVTFTHMSFFLAAFPTFPTISRSCFRATDQQQHSILSVKNWRWWAERTAKSNGIYRTLFLPWFFLRMWWKREFYDIIFGEVEQHSVEDPFSNGEKVLSLDFTAPISS